MPTLLHMNRRVLGPAVRAIREALGIKGSEFAIRIDVSPGYLTNIEVGRKQPSSDVAHRIAGELGVPLDAITYPLPECRTCTRAAA